MKIIFKTKRLKRSFYQQAIMKYVSLHFTASQQDQIDELRQWTVKIMPVEDATGAFQAGLVGTFATGIPHGNTGKRIVNMYLNDNAGDLYFRMNFRQLSHELAHMILNIKYPSRYGVLKFNERLEGVGWGRKGQRRKFFSVEIHNREWETRTGKKRWLRNVTLYTKRGTRWNKIILRGLDISDLK